MIRAPHTDVEALCDAQGKEWARLMLEEHLALRASVEKRVEVTGADGVERRSSRDSERHLETVVGTVVVPRAAYQAPGCEDLHPQGNRIKKSPCSSQHRQKERVVPPSA
jgi:hypothetical protein